MARVKEKYKIHYDKSDVKAGYLCILPSFTVFLVFIAFPVVFSLFISFHKWAIITPDKPFVGIGNYIELFTNSEFGNAMWNTLRYALGSVLGTTFFSFILALILNKGIKARNLFRTVYFLPVVTSMVVVSVIASSVFDANYGLVNQAIGFFGIKGPAWFYDPSWAMVAVIITSIWKHTGYFMVIFLAGLSAIPEVFYDCADIDGAKPLQKLLYITLPLLGRVTALVVVMLTIESFKVFTLVYVMTGGGPLNSTETIVNYLYREGFESFKMGYSSAIAWVLFIIILLITLLQMRFIGGRSKAIGKQL